MADILELGGARMFKLVIVDDEKLDREGLKNQIDWESLGITSVSTAKNGFEAIREIEEIKPDILISDIKMPGMNGLILAEKALVAVPGIKVIFTSGFDDFEYVRSALKMEAFEYILKPIETCELVSALRKAIGARLREKKEEEERQLLIERVNETEPLLKQKFWREVLYGTVDRSMLHGRMSSLGIPSDCASFLAILCEIDDFHTLSRETATAADKALAPLLKDLMYDVMEEGCLVEWVQLEEGRHVGLFSFLDPMTPDQIREYVRCVAKGIVSEAANRLGQSLTIGIGCVVGSIADLHISYSESCHAAGQKMFVGKGSVLFYYPKTSVRNNSIDVQNIGEQLMQSISAVDINKAFYYIDCLFESIEAGNIYDRKYVQNCCFNIISRIDITLADLHEKLENIFGENEVLWDKLMRFETILDIRQWMKNVFRAVIEYLEGRNAGKNRKIVGNVVKYIEDNYAQDITLKGIANELFYSPNHLGYLFKEETGRGFSEYLAEYRMKKAGELLKTSLMKTYEVANMVGYKNISAFINQFKSVFNMTPTEYRERV